MTQPALEKLLSETARALPPPPPAMDAPTVRYNFAGGSPDPHSLPARAVAEVAARVLAEQGEQALAYGGGSGYAGLIEQLLLKLRRDNDLEARPESVVLTAGAAQAVELLCTALVNPGDTVFAEEPTWSGAVRMFATHRARVVGISMDDEGMRVDELAGQLSECRARGIQPKLIYTIPTFQNPTGVTLSLERRHALLALAAEYGVPVVEDDAYFDLRFAGQRLPMLGALDEVGLVVTVGTFSKIFAAGVRLGWAVGPRPLIDAITRLKPPGGTNPFASYVTAEYAASGALEQHIGELVAIYHARRDAMLAALEASMPGAVAWTRPNGGFFVWLTLPEGLDSEAMLPEALAHGVAFVPGTLFSTGGGGRYQIRLSYSFADEEEIRRGIEILGGIIREHLADRGASD